MRRAIAIAIIVIAILILGGCKARGGPGTPEYNKRHHLTDTPEPAMPNPDPSPERRGPGRPPAGKYVSFHVTAAKGQGTVIATYKIGGGEWQTFEMSGTKHWGSIAPVGTPVSLLAAPKGTTKADGTFKHGIITVRITREPAKAEEGGPIVCENVNGTDDTATGGAQCAGNV